MKSDNIRKENRRALPKFLLILVAAMVFGGVCGYFSAATGTAGLANTARSLVEATLTAITPWGIAVTGAAVLVMSTLLYRSAKRAWAAWDEEDEDAIGRIEAKLSYALLSSSVELVVSFFFLSASFVYCRSGAAMLWVLGQFVLVMVGLVLLQQRVVDFEKQMNPEKKGSVYDFKFQKKWLESCDEAERSNVYQSAFKAYNAGVTACITLWVVLVFLGLVFDIGLLPSFVVLLVWGILLVTYCMESIRLERGKR